MAEMNDNKMIVDDNEPTTFGQPLSNFLLQLEDYTPTVSSSIIYVQIVNKMFQIPDAVTAHFLRNSGCDAKDPRLIRLISIAAQKFISDIANDALQHCKMRSSNSSSSHSSSKVRLCENGIFFLKLNCRDQRDQKIDVTA